MDFFEIRDGGLHCEDVPLDTIASEVGTPVYVYSAATLRRHARVMREALSALEALRAGPSEAVERSRPVRIGLKL